MEDERKRKGMETKDAAALTQLNKHIAARKAPVEQQKELEQSREKTAIFFAVLKVSLPFQSTTLTQGKHREA